VRVYVEMVALLRMARHWGVERTVRGKDIWAEPSA
jgi:hypothetical protein